MKTTGILFPFNVNHLDSYKTTYLHHYLLRCPVTHVLRPVWLILKGLSLFKLLVLSLQSPCRCY